MPALHTEGGLAARGSCSLRLARWRAVATRPAACAARSISLEGRRVVTVGCYYRVVINMYLYVSYSCTVHSTVYPQLQLVRLRVVNYGTVVATASTVLSISL